MELRLTERSTEKLLEAVKKLKAAFKSIQCDECISFLENHLIYCKTKLKALQDSTFINVIRNDLEFYRQKEILNKNRDKIK